MTRKSKKKRKHPRTRDNREPAQVLGEDRRSVAVTVAWMMSTLATAAAIVLDGIAYLLTTASRANAGQPSPLAALPGVLLFIAVITGSLTLVLIPVVYRVRVVAPPSLVTIGSACVGGAPWIVLLVYATR